jgi:glucose/arabinose dehydrogenase
MNNTDHVTRTLLLSQKVPGVLIVSRGSAGNIDSGVVDIKTSRAQIKSFDLNKIGDNVYDFTNDGTIIGWGIRNAVGIAEDPTSGALYSVENSSDDLWRLGEDIHENNPGEKLNFHGYLNGTKTTEEGGNFGYPNCYAAWNVTDMPENGNLTVGKQFAVNITTTINDDFCQKERVAPRLTFQAHMAPLDIKFSADGKEAYVTFHGSWYARCPLNSLSSTNFPS